MSRLLAPILMESSGKARAIETFSKACEHHLLNPTFANSNRQTPAMSHRGFRALERIER